MMLGSPNLHAFGAQLGGVELRGHREREYDNAYKTIQLRAHNWIIAPAADSFRRLLIPRFKPASSFCRAPGVSSATRTEGSLSLTTAVFAPDYATRLPAANHRAAASALSSGRVLKAIAAPGAALRIELMTTSNNARQRGGKRTPAPITTQS